MRRRGRETLAAQVNTSWLDPVKRLMPARLRYWLGAKRVQLGRLTAVTDRLVDFSELRRLDPYRPAYGWYRGHCIDRYYIEQFIGAHRASIRGAVLEVAEPMYANMFGGSAIERVDIVDVDPRNPRATLHADLTHATSIADATFDTIICTQTLHCIYDFGAAFRELHRMLKPGGTLLATVPGIAQLCPPSMMGAGRDYWRFTSASIGELARRTFGESGHEVRTFGNVYSAIAFLHGLVSTELALEELDHHDPAYEVIIGLRATKAAG